MIRVACVGRARSGSALVQGDVVRVGSVLVVRGSAAPAQHGADFGPIGDDDITQVDGVPVLLRPETSTELAETTPIPIVVVESGIAFWGRARRAS